MNIDTNPVSKKKVTRPFPKVKNVFTPEIIDLTNEPDVQTSSIGTNTDALEAVELEGNPALVAPSRLMSIEPSTSSISSFGALQAVEFRPLAQSIAVGTIAGGAGMLLGHLTSRLADKLLFDKSSSSVVKPDNVIINVSQRQAQRQGPVYRRRMKK
jgi:hypothetical protein